MRAFTSFATLCALGSAVAIEANTQLDASAHAMLDLEQHQEPALNIVPFCEDCIEDFSYEGHKDADPSTHGYNGHLPGADFNKKVYHFEESDNIFDQEEYEARVQAEAELMIALEALKQTIIFMRTDIDDLRAQIVSERNLVSSTFAKSRAQTEKLNTDFEYFRTKRDLLYDDCAFNQHEMDDNRDALVLYCQQFAFASDMAIPCQSLLSCNEKQLRYKFSFPGDYQYKQKVHTHVKQAARIQAPPKQRLSDHGELHAVQSPGAFENGDLEMYSTHGFTLNEVGGNVAVAPGTNAELAAAAVSHDTAVIQHNGKSIYAPISQIDPSKVELACDDDGCALIPDDGNPYNDVIVQGTTGYNDHHDEHDDHDHHDGPQLQGAFDGHFEDHHDDHFDQMGRHPSDPHHGHDHPVGEHRGQDDHFDQMGHDDHFDQMGRHPSDPHHGHDHPVGEHRGQDDHFDQMGRHPSDPHHGHDHPIGEHGHDDHFDQMGRHPSDPHHGHDHPIGEHPGHDDHFDQMGRHPSDPHHGHDHPIGEHPGHDDHFDQMGRHPSDSHHGHDHPIDEHPGHDDHDDHFNPFEQDPHFFDEQGHDDHFDPLGRHPSDPHYGHEHDLGMTHGPEQHFDQGPEQHFDQGPEQHFDHFGPKHGHEEDHFDPMGRHNSDPHFGHEHEIGMQHGQGHDDFSFQGNHDNELHFVEAGGDHGDEQDHFDEFGRHISEEHFGHDHDIGEHDYDMDSGFSFDEANEDDLYHYEQEPLFDPYMSTHGMILNDFGGNVEVADGTNAELAAAAVDPNTVVIQHNGESYYAPIDQVDPTKVELACIDDGCALIPDDGNAYNDIIVPGM